MRKGNTGISRISESLFFNNDLLTFFFFYRNILVIRSTHRTIRHLTRVLWKQISYMALFLVKSIGFPCPPPPHAHTHLHHEYRCPLFTVWLMAALQVNSSQFELSFLMPGSTVHLYFPTCHFSPEERPNQIPVPLLINSVISQFLTQQINTAHS